MTIINEASVLIQKYIRAGLTPAQAHRKATEVMEIRDDMRPGNPTTPEGELLRQAEQEWLIGEAAMAEYVDQVVRPARLTISRRLDGFYLERGRVGLLLTGREIAALLDQARRQLSLDRKARKANRIHARRTAEGREAFRVVGGRLVTNEQAA